MNAAIEVLEVRRLIGEGDLKLEGAGRGAAG
jgi:hypothetical protein